MSKYLPLLLIPLFLLSACKKEDEVPFEDEEDPTENPGETPVTGTTWSEADPDFDEKIDAMLTHDGNLYVSFVHFDGSNVVYSGRYDGTSVTNITGPNGSGTGFTKLRERGGTMYGVGAIGSAGAYRFTGSAWSTEASNTGTFVNIYDIERLGDKTVVGFGSDPNINIEGSSGAMETMGDGFDSGVLALTTYNGEIIAGGGFTASGSTTLNHIARWDGSSWQPLGDGLDGSVSDLTVYGDLLVAIGSFTTAGSVSASKIAFWDGSTWSAAGSGIQGGANGMRTVLAHGTELFVGGDFDTAGGISSPNVAKWNGSSWEELAGGAPNIVGSIAVFEDKLYIAIEFSGAGNNFFLRLDP